jgi:hypothetical protein
MHCHLVVVLPVYRLQGRKKVRIARASSNWLDIQYFDSTAAAVQALRAEVRPGSAGPVQHTSWATPGQISSTGSHNVQLLTQHAMVMGPG